MVVRTPPALSLKRAFLPQIHQPLPLSRRESQQLLDAITTSFRKNLDKEHPWHQDEPTSHGPPSASANAQFNLPPNPTKNHRPTDSHLRAILTNPLFSHPQDAKPSPPRNFKNPFDVFDSAVSRGLMTPRRAAGFLATVRSQIVKESADNVQQRMAKSGAGLRVVQWLRASGQENDLHFLSDTSLIQNIIPFMYAEGLQEIVWVWLARLAMRMRTNDLEFETRPDRVNARSLSKLLSTIIKETSGSRTGAKISLDSSYSALAKANDILSIQNQLAANNIQRTWEGLSWESTVNARERPKPSASLFDSFLGVGRPFKLNLDLAHLDLHHPTTPEHSAAIEYLHLKNRIEGDIADMERNARAQRRIICLALDTADRLKQVGKSDEASWVERFLTRLYDGLNLGLFNVQGTPPLRLEAPFRSAI
ncbi:hypothetical protein F5X99DRAFT_374410 [Biscogniauxia marginata]|nr:hypothetical protein F5X99DRAFT_374410 [Biscogniauxia marginata]